MAVIKKAPSDIAAKIAAYVLTAGFALLCILPMWHVILWLPCPIPFNWRYTKAFYLSL